MRLRRLFRPKVMVMPKALGECPKAMAGRHVSGETVGYRCCLLCTTMLDVSA